MYKKSECLLKVDALVKYAADAGKDITKLNTLVETLKSNIEYYYNVDFNSKVEDCLKALTHGLMRTNIQYVDGTSGTTEGAPLGFDDLREVFKVGDRLMNVKGVDFFKSIIEVLPEPLPGGDGTVILETYYQSNLIDELETEFIMASVDVAYDLKQIATFGQQLNLSNVLSDIFEPKEMLSVPSISDIANDIYINKHYLDVIRFYDLDIFIPRSVVVGDD